VKVSAWSKLHETAEAVRIRTGGQMTVPESSGVYSEHPFEKRNACPQGKWGPARCVVTWRKREVDGNPTHRDSLIQTTTATHWVPVGEGAAQETHFGAARRRGVLTLEVARLEWASCSCSGLCCRPGEADRRPTNAGDRSMGCNWISLSRAAVT